MRLIKTLFLCSLAIWMSGDVMAQETGREKKVRNLSGRRAAGSRPNLAALLKKLDANGDSVISGDEIPARMAERLARMDLDGSGAIEASEVRQVLQRLREAGTSSGKRVQRRDGEKGKPLRDRTPTSEDSREAERYLERVLGRFDRNNDGKIGQEEAPERLQRIWDRLDQDGNQVLDGEELMTLRRMIASREDEKGKAAKQRNATQRGEGQSRPGIKPKRPGRDG